MIAIPYFFEAGAVSDMKLTIDIFYLYRSGMLRPSPASQQSFVRRSSLRDRTRQYGADERK